MWASDTGIVKEGIHGNFPESRELRLSFTRPRHGQAIVGHPVVQGVRPICVGARVSHWDGRRGARVVGKLGFL